jgi:adenosyl cobinamide kinase/adenosyl cobinamide phosphate guanylyltransferase
MKASEIFWWRAEKKYSKFTFRLLKNSENGRELVIIDCIKVIIKVKLALEQTMKTQRGLELQLYSFFNLGAR